MQKDLPEYHFSDSPRDQWDIPTPHLPTRYAETTLLVVRRRNDDILVINATPDTWNQWMLPFLSITGELNEYGGSLKQAVAQLKDIAVDASSMTKNIQSKLEEISISANSVPVILGDPEMTVKYSPRTSAWTLYRFVYMLIDDAVDMQTGENSCRVWLAETELASKQSSTGIASNVHEAFARLAGK